MKFKECWREKQNSCIEWIGIFKNLQNAFVLLDKHFSMGKSTNNNIYGKASYKLCNFVNKIDSI